MTSTRDDRRADPTPSRLFRTDRRNVHPSTRVRRDPTRIRSASNRRDPNNRGRNVRIFRKARGPPARRFRPRGATPTGNPTGNPTETPTGNPTGNPTPTTRCCVNSVAFDRAFVAAAEISRRRVPPRRARRRARRSARRAPSRNRTHTRARRRRGGDSNPGVGARRVDARGAPQSHRRRNASPRETSKPPRRASRRGRRAREGATSTSRAREGTSTSRRCARALPPRWMSRRRVRRAWDASEEWGWRGWRIGFGDGAVRVRVREVERVGGDRRAPRGRV